MIVGDRKNMHLSLSKTDTMPVSARLETDSKGSVREGMRIAECLLDSMKPGLNRPREVDSMDVPSARLTTVWSLTMFVIFSDVGRICFEHPESTTSPIPVIFPKFAVTT